MINVPCPNPGCGRTLRMSEKFIGKKVGCTYCAQPFVVESAPPPSEQVTTSGLAAPTASAVTTAPGTSSTLASGKSAVAPAMSSASSRAAAPPPPAPEDAEEPEPPRGPPRLPSGPREVGAGLRVGSLLVSLLSLAVIAGSLAGIVWILRGPAAAQEQEEQAQRWAAVSIESKGVRLLIVDAKHGDGNPEFIPLEMGNRDWSVTMPKPLPGSPPQAVTDLEAILAKMNETLDQYEVPREYRRVACTNKLLDDVEERDRERAQKWLEASVRDKLGLKLDVIDAGLEAEYGARASIARRYRKTSLYLDIGTGSTKYGYFEDGSNFRGLSAKLGGRQAQDEIGKIAKDQKLTAAEAAEKWRPVGDKAVTDLTAEAPKLESAERYYLFGGTAWAATVLSRPNYFRHAADKRDATVKLTADDIATALSIAKTHKTPAEIKQAVLAKAEAPRGALDEELDRVLEVFRPDQLVARLSLLKCFSDKCGFATGKKEVLFYTRGLHAWPLGYIAVEGGFER